MEFKGTRRKWLKEGIIESRAYRSRSAHSKQRKGQEEAETARKLGL